MTEQEPSTSDTFFTVIADPTFLYTLSKIRYRKYGALKRSRRGQLEAERMLKQSLLDCRDYIVLCKYLDLGSEKGNQLMQQIVEEIRQESR